MYKAVILNAGEGKRLRPLTNLKPKCLLKLNDTTILEHQLTNLMECGIKKVVIVVGYHANQIIQEIRSKSLNLDIKFIHNPIFYKTNTVYSLWLAKDYIKDDFIYLNGDVVFHKKILKSLLASQYDTCIAVEKRKVGEEEVKVRLISDQVKTIGKEVKPTEAYGEFIGIAKFSKKFNNLFIKKLNDIAAEGKINFFFEAALNRTLKQYKVHAIDISDLPCIEVDTHEDFNTARRAYEAIKGKNQSERDD